MADLQINDPGTGAYSSFAGAQIIATIEGAVVANLQSLTLNTTRETVPIYVLGSPSPISFNRNKRAVAGSMVFVNFDRAVLLDTLKHRATNASYRQKVKNGVIMAAGNVTQGYTQKDDGGSAYIAGEMGSAFPIDEFYKLSSSVQEYQAMTQFQMSNNPASKGFRNVPITMEDQLPPFDVCLFMANESGATAHFAVRGCMIMNTATGYSIDDSVSSKACTFVARFIEDLKPGLSDSGQAGYADMLTIPSIDNYYNDSRDLDIWSQPGNLYKTNYGDVASSRSAVGDLAL
jgi:sporulation protein YlmC with PRC-barrel domain